MSDQTTPRVSRRKLLIGGLAAAGAGTAAALHWKPWYRPLGSNTEIRLGIAGTGSKGIDHINHFKEIPGARILAICDPDPNQIGRSFEETGLKRDAVQVYSDYRELIGSAEIDAVVIASPNHWHAIMGVWAMRAGKHIYVEKPVAHSIWEGQKLVEVAGETGLVAQAGTQRRSDEAYHEAAQWLASGQIGNITSVHAVVYRQRKRVTRRKSPTPLPEGIDYDHWCGPAPKEELFRGKLHYDWHWHWSTGNGELGNNGIHFLDVARIILGEDGLPETATSIGGRFAWEDDAGQTPNSQLVLFDYPTPLVAEMRNLPRAKGFPAMDAHSGIREGVVVHCEGGTLAWPVAKDKDGKKVKKFTSHDGHGHRINWLKAIADNRPGDLNAPIGQGHVSSALCHLGNASHRAGQGRSREEIAAHFSGTAAAQQAFEQLATHLDKNEVDLLKTPFTLGPPTGLADASSEVPQRSGYQFDS